VASTLIRSSYLAILSTRSPITFSRCRILDSCVLLTASWSTMSVYNRWISIYISRSDLVHSFCKSSCSSLHSTVDSSSNLTFSASEFPAPWTCLIFAETSSFHFFSSVWLCRRVVVYDAYVFRLCTIYSRKWCTS
jgi:hypothetical protein